MVPPDAEIPACSWTATARRSAFTAARAGWLREFRTEGLVRHDSDELHIFIGGDPGDPENLNATVEFQIENDRLVFDERALSSCPPGGHAVSSVGNSPGLFSTT
jgi:hypothetical protein